jgi:hypothetical protein
MKIVPNLSDKIEYHKNNSNTLLYLVIIYVNMKVLVRN